MSPISPIGFKGKDFRAPVPTPMRGEPVNLESGQP